jgi:hypothetical protein
MTKKIAIVLVIENIERFLQQIKLLIKTIRYYNPDISIYAITPTKHKLTNVDQQWLKSWDVKYVFNPDTHDACRGKHIYTHNAIMKPQVCSIATDIIDEDYILCLDNDAICLKSIPECFSNLDTYVHTVPLDKFQHIKFVDKTLQQYLTDFRSSTNKHLKLLKHSTITTNIWPTSWVVFNHKNTTFWKRWRDYIYSNTISITTNKLLGKYNLQEILLEQLTELFLYDEFISDGTGHVDNSICQLCYLDIAGVDNLDCVFYNYGGFEQQAYKIADIPIVSRYITDHNITLDTNIKNIAQIDPGWYSKHNIK